MDWKRFLCSKRGFMLIIGLLVAFPFVESIIVRCQLESEGKGRWWSSQLRAHPASKDWEIQICDGFGILKTAIWNRCFRLEKGLITWLYDIGLTSHSKAKPVEGRVCKLGGSLASTLWIPVKVLRVILMTSLGDILAVIGLAEKRKVRPSKELGLAEILFQFFCGAIFELLIYIFYWWIKQLWNYVRISPSLRQEIVRKYAATQLIESNGDFHQFQMVCKNDGHVVFVKCRRATANIAARLAFARETRSLKTLKHPGIVELVDWIRVGIRSCIVVEFASHGNLKTAVEKAKTLLEFSDKLLVYRQIVEAVHWLHQNRWVHLNIRPVNVLVFECWALVKISGFTRAVKAKPGHSCSMYELHPACAAPEVTNREPFNPFKVDQWGLGGLLFFILVGYPVRHEEAILLNRAMSFLHSESNDPGRLGLSKLISALLSTEPDHRPNLSLILNSLDQL